MPGDRLEEASGRLYHLLSPGVALGGGPMWGVNGVACVAHGSSRAPQIVGTIKQAKQAIDSGFVGRLRGELERIQELIGEQ
jgi:fatty acid/phospholipid biosynthesis enzyme